LESNLFDSLWDLVYNQKGIPTLVKMVFSGFVIHGISCRIDQRCTVWKTPCWRGSAFGIWSVEPMDFDLHSLYIGCFNSLRTVV
jgi:hypothetical protein